MSFAPTTSVGLRQVGGPAITHVMYADDIVLFSKATRNDAANIIKCIEKYCSWSGQEISWNKSGIFFSKHSRPNIRREIKHQLHMKILKKEAIYLGASLFLTRSPTKDFKFLLDKLETKLMGWRSKCLSWAGRSTLISSVAQAIPNYFMSSFNIPAKICDKLDSTSRRFWWKPKASVGKFIAWNSWDKLCQPKSLGGLGFKKAKDFNNAMLAKLAWMVASKRDSICVPVARAKYKVRHDWLYSN